MQQKHTLYIITPCRNAASTIEYTLKSVLSQRGDFVVYYHVQDSLSQDNTLTVLKNWEKNFFLHPNIHFSFSSEQDLNMYDGIQKAFDKFDIPNDSFMGWINADDILNENALLNLCKGATLLPEYSWFGGFATATNIENTIFPPKKDLLHPQTLLHEGLCDASFWPCLQQEGTFWKKELWDKAGGLNTNFFLAGDWDLWRRMAKYSPYIQLPCIMGIFRRRDGQLSSDIRAYQQEINKTIPFSTRQDVFNKIYDKRNSIPYQQVIDNNGVWVLSNNYLKLSKKTKFKLFLLRYQFNTLLYFLQSINKAIKKLFKS